MLIDVLYLALLGFAVYTGIRRGFIIAVCSMAGLLIGLVAALQLSGMVANKLRDSFSSLSIWAPFIAFIVVFLATVLLIRLAAKLIESSIAMVKLSWLNKGAGICLYAIIYTLTYSVFLFYGKQLRLIHAATIDDSISYAFIAPWGPTTLEGLSTIFPSLKDLFLRMEDFFSHAPEN